MKYHVWIVVLKIQENKAFEYHCAIAYTAQAAADVVRKQFPNREILLIAKKVTNWK